MAPSTVKIWVHSWMGKAGFGLGREGGREGCLLGEDWLEMVSERLTLSWISSLLCMAQVQQTLGRVLVLPACVCSAGIQGLVQVSPIAALQ